MSVPQNARFALRAAAHPIPRVLRAARATPPVARAALKTFRLDLPQFPLEVALRGVPAHYPCVLATTDTPAARVLFANAPAASRGARVEQPLRVVNAFGPEIRCVARQPAMEVQGRELLVRWLHALGCTVDVTVAANGALTLHGVLASARPDDVWRTRLRRDLRAFGLRAQLELPAAADRESHGAAAYRHAAGGFTSQLELPWPVTHAHALIPAVTRLLDELRVIHEAEQRAIRWIQWTFHDLAGARHHHVIEVDRTLPLVVRLARLGAWTRERLHRMSGTTPWSGVALKAALD